MKTRKILTAGIIIGSTSGTILAVQRLKTIRDRQTLTLAGLATVGSIAGVILAVQRFRGDSEAIQFSYH